MTDEYDACIIVGDCTYSDIQNIKYFWGDKPIYGVLGNHDDKNLFIETGIIDLNGKNTEIAGLKVAGIEGCVKYKSHQPGYTEEEGMEMIKYLEDADILISHALPYGTDKSHKTGVHSGSKFVEKYIYDRRIPLVICGHNHKVFTKEMSNGTLLYECCGIHNLYINKN